MSSELCVQQKITLECINALGEECKIKLIAGQYYKISKLSRNANGTFDITFDKGYKGEEVTSCGVSLEKIKATWLGDPEIIEQAAEPETTPVTEETDEVPEAEEDKTRKWF